MKLTAAQQKYSAYWLTRSLSSDRLGQLMASVQNAQVGLIRHPINVFYITLDKEIENLKSWANDLRFCFENDIFNLDTEIKLRKSESRKTSRLDEKVRLQRLIKDLEKRRSEKRLNLYQAQDEVDEKKENLLAKVKAMFAHKIEQTKLVTFHWRIV